MTVGDEIFESAVRAEGDLAGLFEYDGEVGYFYLYGPRRQEGQKIIDSLRVVTGNVDLHPDDVSVQWDQQQQRVGLFLRGVLWAVFNISTGDKYGAMYQVGEKPKLPPEEVFEI
jgi:hypothetical protein